MLTPARLLRRIILIAFGVPLVLGIVLFVWIILNLQIKTTRNIKDITINNKYDYLYDCFPYTTTNSDIIDFVSTYNTFDINQYFLKIKYTKSDFDVEINRLNKYSLNNQFLDYDKNCNLFNYPTYICNYWSGKEYQYVCIDNENRTIAYVYVYQSSIEDILFDTKYLPKNFVINRDSKTKDNLYGGLTVFSDEDEIVWESVLNNA